MIDSINQLFNDAVQKNVSDIHLTVNTPPIYRINGELVRHNDIPMHADALAKMAKEILGSNWGSFQKSGEIDFAYELKGIARFRINIFYQRGFISIAARTIAEEIPTIEQLGLPVIINRLTKKPHGLILVTGPTGSGKSTTLAAMIHHINEHAKKHIVTLEDPIEYIHKNINSIVQQREVGKDTKEFRSGLRAALRQDPDVILVGEMRDLETISTAITAAETGHLVLATLHTNSAAQTINRMIDVFPPHQQAQVRIQLSSVLGAIISQRLIKRIDHSGRVAATEILINQPAVANLISNEKISQINNVLQTSKSAGMHTLNMDIQTLMQRGIISREEATSYMQEEGVQ